jgi:hypothetical protein
VHKNKYFKFVPFGIAPLTAFSVLNGVCSPAVAGWLNTLRLENAAKSAIQILGDIKYVQRICLTQ